MGKRRTADPYQKKRGGHYASSARPRPTGTVIVAMFEGDPFFIYETPGASVWANPSMAGKHSIIEVEYFEQS